MRKVEFCKTIGWILLGCCDDGDDGVMKYVTNTILTDTEPRPFAKGKECEPAVVSLGAVTEPLRDPLRGRRVTPRVAVQRYHVHEHRGASLYGEPVV